MAAFKNEKQFQEWLAANPKAAARMCAKEEIIVAPKPKLVATDGVSVVVKMPSRRPVPTNHYAAVVTRFDRAMAWLFVGAVMLGSMGVVATVSAMLALEYLR